MTCFEIRESKKAMLQLQMVFVSLLKPKQQDTQVNYTKDPLIWKRPMKKKETKKDKKKEDKRQAEVIFSSTHKTQRITLIVNLSCKTFFIVKNLTCKLKFELVDLFLKMGCPSYVCDYSIH